MHPTAVDSSPCGEVIGVGEAGNFCHALLGASWWRGSTSNLMSMAGLFLFAGACELRFSEPPR